MWPVRGMSLVDSRSSNHQANGGSRPARISPQPLMTTIDENDVGSAGRHKLLQAAREILQADAIVVGDCKEPADPARVRRTSTGSFETKPENPGIEPLVRATSFGKTERRRRPYAFGTHRSRFAAVAAEPLPFGRGVIAHHRARKLDRATDSLRLETARRQSLEVAEAMDEIAAVVAEASAMVLPPGKCEPREIAEVKSPGGLCAVM